MSTQDAASLANTAVRLGLVSLSQVEEGWSDLGSRNGEADEFLRTMERKGFLTPFQSGKLLKGDKDGYFLGGYRILYKIASGSFGRVYRADDPHTGKIVALKVLRRKWTEDKHKVDLFTREGRMGMTLHHPNIVEIIAVNHDKKTHQYYIVMEFVEGGNLRDLTNIRGKLAVADVLKILEEVGSGLAYALSKGTTHRDMKLTNVLISSQGPVKLVDFGLAGGNVGFEEKDTDLTVDRTVDYAGLEKATGAPTGDPRSDIFFLGCVAYELLTGRSPLETTRSAQARMAAQRFQKVPPMSPEEVQGPASLFRLVERMMALEPDQRFQTAAQMLESVREVRHEVEGKGSQQGKSQRTLFLVESDERLQDLLRDKLKEQGFRVLIAADPTRAQERFRQQPYHVLIVNASTTGENGCYAFQKIVEDAAKHNQRFAAILLVNEEQADWKERLADKPSVAVLPQPVKYKKLVTTIHELADAAAAP